MEKITTRLCSTPKARRQRSSIPPSSPTRVDALWARLADGGEEIACGWITDRYGVAWQIVPTRLQELLSDPDCEKAQRVMGAMLKMKKIEISELEHAAA